jgi:NAD(P)-dependent dehydrogenase (short-subunit alcohol dehydrogenase family)
MATGYCVRRHFGLEIAHSLASAGCDLVITSRTLADAEASAALLAEEHQVQALGLALDVSDFSSVEQAAAAAIAAMGKIDILVNNAGGGSGPGANVGGIFDRSNEAVESLIQANLMGSFWCCKVFGEHMVSQGYGKIINIGSIAGMVGRNDRMYDKNNMQRQPIDYAVAKSGITGLTLDLAGHLGPSGVRVNMIAPGGFAGDCVSPNGGINGDQEPGPGRAGPPAGFIKDFSGGVPLGHMGRDGKDLGGAALFLAAAASDYVTGITLPVDGGFSIWH